MTQEY